MALGLLALACRDKQPEPSAPPSEPQKATPTAAPARPESYDFIGHLEGCEVRHGGLLIDLGTGAARARRSFRVEPIEDMTDAERDGATVSRVLERRVTFDIVIDEPLEEAKVSVRLYDVTARTISASLDDKRLGASRLTVGETKVVDFPSVKNLAAGRHSLSLNFSGRPRGETLPYVEIDWIRVRGPSEMAETYAAPTLRDIVTDAVLDSTPRRAIALRAPGAVRCPITVARDSELQVDLGYWGEGKGETLIRVLTDGEKPVILAERKVVGGEGATWTPLHIPLGPHSARPVLLELAAPEAARGGRVLFGDPRLTRAETAADAVPSARTIVVVVVGGLDQHMIPPWRSSEGLTAFGTLAKSSAIFTAYRSPSNVVGAVVASLLTGLPPAMHGLEDPAARLSKAARGLGELLKEAGGRTAMFTAVPPTFSAFGFEQGWDKYESFSPVGDQPATTPIDEAKKWLENESDTQSGRRLVVVHAPGVHPPWDVTKEEALQLPPQEYGGLLDPRRGGVILAKLRTQRRNTKRLGDDDWKRMRALEELALSKQNTALEALLSMLKSKGMWDSTLFVVVGDVGAGNPPAIPFEPAGELEESRLLVPLLVRFPGGKFAAKEITYPVTSMDVTTTVLDALGIARPRDLEGLDLYRVASGDEPLSGRALVATLAGHYASRLGVWLLRGIPGQVPKLCQLDVDPACNNDAFPDKLIAGSTAWQWTFDEFRRSDRGRLSAREPASIDPDVGAALTVWGDI